MNKTQLQFGYRKPSAKRGGLAQLAMHSAFETASAKDAGDLLALMRAYYSSALERTEDGCRVI